MDARASRVDAMSLEETPSSAEETTSSAEEAPSIDLLVLGQSEAELEDFLRRSPTAATEAKLNLVANPKKKLGGLALLANQTIDRGQGSVVGAVHADTTFAPGAITVLARAALEGAGRVVGLVGRGFDPIFIVWGSEGGGPVSTLDSCSVFMPRSLGLRFDAQTFDDFHCAVEDLCIAAAERSIPIFVPAVDAGHTGEMTIKNPTEWLPNYYRYKELLHRKWPGRVFVTTGDPPRK